MRLQFSSSEEECAASQGPEEGGYRRGGGPYRRTPLQPPPRPSPLWPVSPASSAEVSCRRLIIDEQVSLGAWFYSGHRLKALGTHGWDGSFNNPSEEEEEEERAVTLASPGATEWDGKRQRDNSDNVMGAAAEAQSWRNVGLLSLHICVLSRCRSPEALSGTQIVLFCCNWDQSNI